MKLTNENLNKANRHFTVNTGSAGEVANGALYLALTEAAQAELDTTGELNLREQPFLMVTGEYVTLAEDCETWVDTGYAIQYFSDTGIPGFMSGYETFSNFDKLVAYLREKGIAVDSEAWVACDRGW